MKSAPPIRIAAALAAVLCAAAAAACQEKPSSLSASFLTYDTRSFDVHNVTRINDQQNTSLDNFIVLVRAKYTNNEILPQFLSPEKFVFFDPHSGQEFTALSGGDINIPPFAASTLQPGESAEITVGFRLPQRTIGGRLNYKP